MKLFSMIFLLMSCTTVRLKYAAQVEDKNKLVANYEFEKTYELSTTDKVLCWTTGIFYGGWCWTYFTKPNQDERRFIKKEAESTLSSKLGNEKYSIASYEISKVSWENEPTVVSSIEDEFKNLSKIAHNKQIQAKKNEAQDKERKIAEENNAANRNAEIKIHNDTVGPEPKNSVFDGSIRCIKDLLTENAHDPDSLEFVQWSKPTLITYEKRFFWQVIVKFRGKNSFGAKILNQKKFWLHSDQVVQSFDMD